MTLDDLERPLRTLLHKICVFRAHHENLNEDRPISRNIRFMQIFAGVPCTGSGKRQWGCRQWQFSAFSLVISSETLDMRPALLYTHTQIILLTWVLAEDSRRTLAVDQ